MGSRPAWFYMYVFFCIFKVPLILVCLKCLPLCTLYLRIIYASIVVNLYISLWVKLSHLCILKYFTSIVRLMYMCAKQTFYASTSNHLMQVGNLFCMFFCLIGFHATSTSSSVCLGVHTWDLFCLLLVII